MKADLASTMLIALLLVASCAPVPSVPAASPPSRELPAATATVETTVTAPASPVPAASLTLPPAVLSPSPSLTPTASTTAEPAIPTVTPYPSAPPPTAAWTPRPATPSDAGVPATRPVPPSAPVPSQTPGPTPDVDIIVDDGDPGFTTTGSWFDGDGGHSYNGDCKWAPRGWGNAASYTPKLPVRGSYEVFGWWCGDPNHDQSNNTSIYIYPTLGRIVPYRVTVDLQQNAGQWVSLGAYFMETVGWVTVGGNLNGNVVADAFRFVYRSPDDVSVTPTPAPTRQIWTNHPPSPLEQLTSGDLSSRLGLVQWMYQYSPLVSSREMDFDDCSAFPREGCSGTRHGWDAVVRYKDQDVAYRVSADYRHVSLQKPEELPGHQTLYMAVTKGPLYMRIDRYPDDTWFVGSSAVSGPLDRASIDELLRLAEKYNTVRAQLPSGFEVNLFGLGKMVELEAGDAAAVQEMIDRLSVHAAPAP